MKLIKSIIKKKIIKNFNNFIKINQFFFKNLDYRFKLIKQVKMILFHTLFHIQSKKIKI